MRRPPGMKARASLAVAATIAVVATAAGTAPSSAAGDKDLAPGVAVSTGTARHAALLAAARRSPATPRTLAGAKLPAGVPSKGRYGFLLELDARPTMAAVNDARTKSAARAAGRDQLARVRTAQSRVIAALPARSSVLYRSHAILSGVAVTTDAANFNRLRALPGVRAVYPIAPKSPSNSYAVPLQGAPAAWAAHGDLGENSTVAVIDTGIDYTHADFGGTGTEAAYDTAHAAEALPADPSLFPSAKIPGGFDLVGDAYDADPTSPTYNPVPAPDVNPLDCNSHGSHVAGTVAGLGENADGSTYTGAYDASTPFDTMRIGPGMAPKAALYAYRVFGCEGSTDVVGAAIDRAADPNSDGDTSDHVDVINLSLGSDFGLPDDADAKAADSASLLGITMVIASGNAGDLYDVGGSPGNAVRPITVAASADASSVVDSLHVTAPAGIAGPYAAQRSVAYDWANDPDLSGDLYQLTDASNLDGCSAYSPADAAGAAGKVVFLEWTDDDTARRCGSVTRGSRAAAAGATGFVFADDREAFAAGITGSDVIPGVIVAKSGGDAIRAELAAAHAVTVGSTTANSTTQLDPAMDDTIADFSSRGVRGAGNVKPDVTAVGASVFSAGNGTGNEGQNDSGTSMATPMVAGVAALVASLHQDWTPEQVKADIMNTAGQDVFTGTSHTGTAFAPNRVGAGRIDVAQALDNDVLAYVSDDPGAVSASFGPLAVSAPTVLTKTIRVQNTGAAAHTFDVGYTARTIVPGAEYTVSPSTVTVAPGASSTVTLTLTLTPSKLTKTIDPTVAAVQGGLPREFVADASGLVTLTSADSPSLRVPVYAAPRPASVMTQASSVTLPGGPVQSALLSLTGQRVNQGSGATAVQSTVAGFALSATSGMAPTCSVTVTSGCVNLASERSADLENIGVTSDAPQVTSLGGDPAVDGLVYFAVNTQKPWLTAATQQEFDIFIDTTGDGSPDVVTFNTRLSDASDVMVAETVDLVTGDVLDAQLINDRFGDTDTALFDSDVLVMPVLTSALGAGSRISYGVASFSPYQSDPIDTVGFNAAGSKVTLGFNPMRPAVAVYGSYDGDASALLYRDSPGTLLKIRKDRASYGLDKAMGALLVHFHNKADGKAQRVLLKTSPSLRLTITPRTGKVGKRETATVVVSNSSGLPATGRIRLVRISPRGTVDTAVLRNGRATLRFESARRRTVTYQATYAGDGNYLAGSSARVKVRFK